MDVLCNREYWDSKRLFYFHVGDSANIDPLEPAAVYFDFPPGTEVAVKIKGQRASGVNKGSPSYMSTRIVPGKVEAEKKPEPEKVVKPKPMETCPICKLYTGTKPQVRMHKIACAKREEAKTEE